MIVARAIHKFSTPCAEFKFKVALTDADVISSISPIFAIYTTKTPYINVNGKVEKKSKFDNRKFLKKTI